ncbi:hypothetical protein ABD76_01030 [Paenibacillus dendritiformis]|uniref:hypothetical protein n=1 Tax=Paenibacillus dendritiformis TaxID=130049 RepID=UPI0018CF2627|nr:hypothetical protein [Paenibacillus dendritiformis]MBG9791183.1 hypothetical protein [Paenibacillus dendritiformis]
MRWIPERWSRQWIRWELCHALVLTLGLCGVRYAAAGAEPAWDTALRMAAAAVAIATILNLSGWLGGRWIWLLGSIGAAVGLAAMFIVTLYRGHGGWEDLIGVLVFLYLFAIGYGCGVLAETALAIYHWIQRRRS